MTLRAGALSARYEDGDLREIRIGDTVACLRLYHAVRDRNWGTVPGAIADERIEAKADSFQIAYTSRHRAGDIDLSAQVTITGDADGTIVYAYDGVAHTTFWRNRIGLCVLHPASAAGDRCAIHHTDGSESDAVFPERLRAEQPVEPFARLAGLTHRLPGGAQLQIAFDGEVFEMEDQRNWSDASYKTFGTPLSLPFPVEVAAGTRVQQSVTVRALPRAATPVGLTLAAWSPPLTDAQIDRLRALNLAHLRVDIRPDHLDHLRRACREANALGVPLELAVYGGDQSAIAAACDAPIVRVLALPEDERVGVRPDYERLADTARAAFPDAPIFLGTDSDFFFVNRFPPPMDLCDGLTFALNPQAHAFDTRSIVETVQAQPAMVATAREIADGKPVAVSPVSLLPRWNPYASVRRSRDAEPPADPRQSDAWFADWTTQCLLALHGADSVTLYETHGPRGVLGLPVERALEERS